jgi:prophage DNA circulation protein
VASFLDTTPECSYEGVEFPVESFTVDGGNDAVDHTAYLVPGADIEPTGRRAYSGSFEVPLVDTADLVRRYGNLSEVKRFELVNLFETTPIGSLVHPTKGQFRVLIADWKETGRGDERNGLRLSITWREHNSEAGQLVTDANATPVDAPATVSARALAADAAAVSLATLRGAAVAGFVPVAATIAARLATLDGAPLGYAATTRTLSAMVDPVVANLMLASLAPLDAHALVTSLLDLRASLYQLASRYVPSTSTLRYFVPKVTMSVADIAFAVYGDASMTQALFAANAFPDPLFVEPGTRVTVIAAPARA